MTIHTNSALSCVKRLLMFCVLTTSLGAKDGLTQTSVVVIPFGGEVVEVPASETIAPDTPGRGNYRTSPSQEGVVDLTTGLEWTKRRSFKITWQEAVEYCSELSLDARGKIWRLPEIDELITLYRFGAAPYIENSVFLSSELSFWSNTIAARSVIASSNPDSRWVAYFTDTRPRDLIEPDFVGGTVTIEHYARCVADAR